MLEDFAITIALVLGAFLAGKIAKTALGERWRTSIRGLLVATAFVAIALYMIVRAYRK